MHKLRLMTFLVMNFFASAMACDSHDCDECRANFVSTKAGSGKWKDPAVPKEAWFCEEVKDLGSASLTCGMCERELIRYVHKMSHGDFGGCLSVGCICAGHMEGNLEGAKEREKYLRNRTSRRDKWLSRQWKSARRTGNPFLIVPKRGKTPAHRVNVFPSKYGQYSFMLDGVLSKVNGWFKTEDDAKLAAFDALYPTSITLN